MKLRHVGIVVEDLERTIKFYTKIFAFKLLERKVEKGNYIDKLVGLKQVVLEWAKMSIDDGNIIEFLQYHSHPDAGKDKIEGLFSANRMGCSHIALEVNDCKKIYDEFVAEHCFCREPQISPNGKVKVMYAYDKDGIILEIVELVK